LNKFPSSRIRLKRVIQKNQKFHDCLGGCGKKVPGWFCDPCREQKNNMSGLCNRYEICNEEFDQTNRDYQN
jgi:hypothetical protein